MKGTARDRCAAPLQHKPDGDLDAHGLGRGLQGIAGLARVSPVDDQIAGEAVESTEDRDLADLAVAAETVCRGKTEPKVTTSEKLRWFPTMTQGRNASSRSRHTFATPIPRDPARYACHGGGPWGQS